MKPIHRLLIALGVFIAASGIGYWLWEQEVSQNRIAERARLNSSLRETASVVEQRMLAYEQVARAVQGLLSLPGHADRAKLQQFAEALQLGADFAGMDGIGVALRVPAAGPAGSTARAPVVQMEPASPGNRRLIGTDLQADPVLRLAMDAARDSGRAAISGKVWLASVGQGAARAGFMMFLPLYTGGTAPGTVAARQAAISGWVVAPVRVDELMASLHGLWSGAGGIRIHDGVELTQASLLYSTTGGTAQEGGFAAPLVTEYLVMGGRTWALAVHPYAGPSPPFGRQVADIIAVAALVLSLLLSALIWVLLSGRSRALQEARRMTAELRESKDHFELIFNASPDSVLIARQDSGEILNVNDGFCRMTGYGRAAVIGRSLDALDLWDNPQERERCQNELRQHGLCDNLEAVFRTCGGATFVGIMSARTASFNGVRCFVGVIRDIGERKAAELRITHMAQHDPLTGLPNRALFADRLQHAIQQARREQSRLALMYLDLDRFKPVNDTLGHAVGDLLLQAAASRMLECVRESDTVGRIGGDEFIVLLPNVKDEQDVLLVAEKIRLALDEPFVLAGSHRISVSSSAGVAIYPEHGSDEIRLQQNADLAMYRAKARGRNRVELYLPNEAAQASAGSGS